MPPDYLNPYFALAAGRRLSCIWDSLKSGGLRKSYAERHGWPFVIHVSNLPS